MQRTALTVKQLNLYVRSLIEGDLRLSDVLVTGELSNFKNHYQSGHLYFTLKDKDASIRCVMFRSYAARLKFFPQDGMSVILRGKVSVYEKDGQYQFYAEDMLPDGIGDIALAFEQVKEKLLAEGLFDADSKRPIPRFPKKIAVITSKTGAAVRDIMNILTRRWPIAEPILYPVSVQGELAVPEMLVALDSVYETDGIDLIIIGRGGGSIEDLWAFNSEELARKIYESPVPVISAVGHETDFTICDFVADLRAPTPSAAAELAVPDISEMLSKINAYENLLKTILQSNYNEKAAKLNLLASSRIFKNAAEALTARQYEQLDRAVDSMITKFDSVFTAAENKLINTAGRLDALSPLKVLGRGYAAVSDGKSAVLSAESLKTGDEITLRFADGSADCEVKKINSLKE